MGKIKDRFFDEINLEDDSAYEDWKDADKNHQRCLGRM